MKRHTLESNRVHATRESIFVEITPNENFFDLLGALHNSSPEVQVTHGSAVEQGTRIQLPGGKVLLGYTYRGDLHGWREQAHLFCIKKKREWAVVFKNKFILSDGTKVPIDDCEIEFKG